MIYLFYERRLQVELFLKCFYFCQILRNNRSRSYTIISFGKTLIQRHTVSRYRLRSENSLYFIRKNILYYSLQTLFHIFIILKCFHYISIQVYKYSKMKHKIAYL